MSLKSNDFYRIVGISIEAGDNPFDIRPFSSVPFCKNGKTNKTQKNPILPFNFSLDKNQKNEYLCSTKVTNKTYKAFQSASKEILWMHLMIKTIKPIDLYSQIGFMNLNEKNLYVPHVFSHFHFDFGTENGTLTSANLTSSKPVEISINSTLNYTYSVNWINDCHHSLADTTFYHSKTRFLSITGSICLIGVLYMIASSIETKKRQCMQNIEYYSAFAASGVSIALTLIISFVYFDIIHQRFFDRYKLIYINIIPAIIGGIVCCKIMKRYQSNDMAFSITLYSLIPPFLYLIYDLMKDSLNFKTLCVTSSAVKTFGSALFSQALGSLGMMCVKTSKQHQTKNENHFTKTRSGFLSSIAFSILIGVSSLTITSSETYYLLSSFVKRKFFDLWTVTAISIPLLFALVWFESRIAFSFCINVEQINIPYNVGLFCGLFSFISNLLTNNINANILIAEMMISVVIYIITFSASFLSLL